MIFIFLFLFLLFFFFGGGGNFVFINKNVLFNPHYLQFQYYLNQPTLLVRHNLDTLRSNRSKERMLYVCNFISTLNKYHLILLSLVARHADRSVALLTLVIRMTGIRTRDKDSLPVSFYSQFL